MAKVRYKYFLKYVRVNWQWVLLLLVLLWSLIHGLFWLMIAISCVILMYKGIVYGIEKIRFTVVRRFLKGFFLFVLIFMVSIGSKILIADIYHIPSSSMENTLLPNDVILVSKLAYGPKLPQNPFEISWINLLFYINDGARAAMKEQWWPYKRLKGSTKIRQNDIIVYELPRIFVVKRCVGRAGDTLAINKGEVLINDKKQKAIETVKNRYRVQVSNKQLFFKQLDSLGITEVFYPEMNFTNDLSGILSNVDKDKLKMLQVVKRIEKKQDTSFIKRKLFALPQNKQWTDDNLGPIVVPKKGMVITFNDFNYEIYKKTLEKHEKINLTKIDSSYYINGKKSNQYTFAQDYYFVMGDNRKQSIDSRYVGFIPESNIVGKVQSVLFSNYQGEFRWNRLMQTVD